MPGNLVVHVRSEGEGVAAQLLRAGLARIQRELGVSPAFPDDVERAAALAASAPRLPDLDRTDLPLVTIDPPGSMDLDQALHLERDGDGYVLHYAIADVGAFVTPGDAVDAEAHRRGETLYGADSRVPLHPPVLSEDAASLLPEQVRPALLWTIRMDATGEGTDVTVVRARVRSTARLDYEGVQRLLDEGSATESLRLLAVVGRLRIEREVARGGVSIPSPEQEVSVSGDDWKLAYRTLLPVEEWNAQMSLLTGFGAATLMVRARVGLLRTLPPPELRDLERLRRTAHALHVDWPETMDYPEFVRSLDPRRPDHAAMVTACTRLLRGSGYVGFDGEVPADSRHAALAAEYAHVTAPLRRLGDRYAGEICLALCAGKPVPAWVLDALPELPKVLQESNRRGHQYESAVLDLVEAGLLSHRVGERFDGVVVDVNGDGSRGVVTIQEPAVEATVIGPPPLPLGTDVSVELVRADLESRKVEFALR